MNNYLIWFLIACVGGLTFSLRFSFVAALGRFQEPAWMQRVTPLIPPAILSALVTSSLILQDHTVQFNLENERLLAGLFAAVIAWRFRNMALTIVSGFIMLYLL